MIAHLHHPPPTPPNFSAQTPSLPNYFDGGFPKSLACVPTWTPQPLCLQDQAWCPKRKTVHDPLPLHRPSLYSIPERPVRTAAHLRSTCSLSLSLSCPFPSSCNHSCPLWLTPQDTASLFVVLFGPCLFTAFSRTGPRMSPKPRSVFTSPLGEVACSLLVAQYFICPPLSYRHVPARLDSLLLLGPCPPACHPLNRLPFCPRFDRLRRESWGGGGGCRRLDACRVVGQRAHVPRRQEVARVLVQPRADVLGLHAVQIQAIGRGFKTDCIVRVVVND